jgi:HCOMODA/2-hydroxy-3-carboxy-muconic semialdehyde decarboxylase
MAGNNVVLMRGHGFAAAGVNLIEVLRIAIYLRENAKVLLDALRLGEVTYLSPGELKAIRSIDPESPALKRAWEYWATEAGVADLL